MRCACKCNQKKGDTDKLFAPILLSPQKNASGGARTRPLPCLSPLLAVRKCRSSHFAVTAKKVFDHGQKGLWPRPKGSLTTAAKTPTPPDDTAKTPSAHRRQAVFRASQAPFCGLRGKMLQYYYKEVWLFQGNFANFARNF
jgi:hypothetical protein